MNDNKELNTLLDKLFSSVKNSYDIGGMIRDIKEKEVRQKDYEIINVRYKQNGAVIAYSEPFYPEYWDIHSVKRLSDIEIFTVGDKTTYGIIESFSIEGTWGINVHFTSGCGGTLASLIKSKEVPEKDYEVIISDDFNNIKMVRRVSDNEAFTISDKTDEGVIKGFYEMDNFLWVRFEEKGGVVSINNIQKVQKVFHAVQKRTFAKLYDCTHPLDKPDNWDVFDTKEEADSFIMMNKPCLSVQDICTLWHLDKMKPINELKELAQQKINNV